MIIGKNYAKVVTLIVNGREFELTPEGSEKVAGATRLLNAVYGTYYYWNGDKKDLTRSKNGKMVLTWLADKLTSEPPELRELLRIAADQMKA
jgi:hypothetical protein